MGYEAVAGLVLGASIDLANCSDLPVYKQEEGQLVQTIKMPNKRYSVTANVTTGETYLLEMTQEEEAELNQQAAQWEADAPKRKAEEEKTLKDQQDFRDALIYEDRIVVFLDVLGWKTAIKLSESDPSLVQDLGISLQWLQMMGGMDPIIQQINELGGQEITQFSDCVVISILDKNSALPRVLMLLNVIVWHLSSKGLFVRGGITKGKLVHKRMMVYGPALIRAYQLESEKDFGKLPRILLDPDCANDLWLKGSSISTRTGEILGHEHDTAWRRDSNGFYFYDWLSQRLWLGTVPSISRPSEEVINDVLEPIRMLIINRLDEYRSDPDVFEKYKWLAEYFNDVLSEHPQSNLIKIA